MKNHLFFLAVVILILNACKEKSASKEDPPISALSIIKGQVKLIDTSLYQITKYETDSNRTDTSWLKREEIKKYAADFLSLPDITEDNYRKLYTEERLIDAGQQTLSITSTAKNEDAEIQKQIIIVALNDIESGKVQSIFIDRFIQAKDSTVQQKLYWEVDKFFRQVNIIQKGNEPEHTQIIKIEWK